MTTGSKMLKVAMIGVSGILYGIVGYVEIPYLCPRAHVLGLVVTFWPSVVFPAMFGMLFGPLVGGVSAVLGLFMSDMLLSQENVPLSATVGVTANFACFYLISYISRKSFNWTKTYLGLGVGGVIVGLIAYLNTLFPIAIPYPFSIFGSICLGCYALAAGFGYVWPELRSYAVATVIGKVTGGAIIGFGIWVFSQFFVLPSPPPFNFQLPLDVILQWLAWTFSSETPFLLAIVPPVLKASYKAFPALMPQQERGR